MRSIQRREALGVIVGTLLPVRTWAALALRPVRDAVDHIVIGISDLERGIEKIEAKTGVRPSIGGSHPGRGTWNALFSLGPRQYAELVAPDPKQKGTADAYGLPAFAEPRLLMWAASTPDIDALAARLKAAGRSDVEVRPGSRVRPDGRRLAWRTLATSGNDGLLPFFIQWDAGTTHPSTDSPAGCRLESLALAAPDPVAVERGLAAVGLETQVVPGPAPLLRATLATPTGPFSL
jgi:hypothetical protein